MYVFLNNQTTKQQQQQFSFTFRKKKKKNIVTFYFCLLLLYLFICCCCCCCFPRRFFDILKWKFSFLFVDSFFLLTQTHKSFHRESGRCFVYWIQLSPHTNTGIKERIRKSKNEKIELNRNQIWSFFTFFHC